MDKKELLKAASKIRVVKGRADSFRIHPEAQRELNPAKLEKRKREMDLDAISVLHAVEYEINGELAIWIIDGQHRWRALMDLDLGEWEIRVEIFVDVRDDARASELFLKLNDRIVVTPYDKFNQAVKAGHTDAVEITNIAKKNALKINRYSGDGSLTCVSALSTVFNYDGGIALGLTLETIIAAWGRTASGMEGKLVEGLGMVYKQYNGAVDKPALVKKLSKRRGGPSGLIGDARGLRDYQHMSISRCISQIIVDLYNAGRKIGKLEKL